MKYKLPVLVLFIAFTLLLQVAKAQRTITLHAEVLRKGDSCMLFGYANAKPVLLQTVFVNEPGIVTVKDNLLHTTAGVYVLVVPEVVNHGSITVLYSAEESNNIMLHYYANGDLLQFDNSDINTAYTAYLKTAYSVYGGAKRNQERYLKATDSTERKVLKTNTIAKLNVLYDYGRKIAAAYKGTLLAKVIDCTNVQPIPGIAWNVEYTANVVTSAAYQSSIDFVKKAYWAGVDFTDTALLNTPYLAGKTEEYTRMFHPKDSVNAQEAIEALLQQASLNDKMYDLVSDILQEIYLKPNTFAYNEDLGKYVLKDMQKRKFTAGWKQQLITSRLTTLSKNAKGTKAADIQITNIDGKQNTLYANRAKFTLLYFFDPHCSRCNRITPVVKNWFEKAALANDLTVWCIYTGEDENEWRSYTTQQADVKNWLYMWDPKSTTSILSKYWVESLPAIYLLDENKTVLLKNASYDQLVDFFAEKK